MLKECQGPASTYLTTWLFCASFRSFGDGFVAFAAFRFGFSTFSTSFSTFTFSTFCACQRLPVTVCPSSVPQAPPVFPGPEPFPDSTCHALSIQLACEAPKLKKSSGEVAELDLEKAWRVSTLLGTNLHQMKSSSQNRFHLDFQCA